MRDFLSEEKGLCAEVESLCMTDPDSAHALIDSVISDCGEVKSDRAQSASGERRTRASTVRFARLLPLSDAQKDEEPPC